MVIYPPERLDRIYAALASQTRRAILNRLTRQDQSVLELTGEFRISQPAVTKHLNVLEQAGMIRRRKHGRYRICRLQAEPLRQAEAWIDEMRRYWEERFAALDEYLEDSPEEETS